MLCMPLSYLILLVFFIQCRTISILAPDGCSNRTATLQQQLQGDRAHPRTCLFGKSPDQRTSLKIDYTNISSHTQKGKHTPASSHMHVGSFTEQSFLGTIQPLSLLPCCFLSPFPLLLYPLPGSTKRSEMM